ncbi:MAG: TlpA family protein disulfide reductase [Magnetococcales bacterium]|nr:TlpA family protein disulfide reductase [Magnetococcales bacterium]
MKRNTYQTFFGIVLLLGFVLLAPTPALALNDGDVAPAFSLPALGENPPADKIELAAYKGQVVLVDYWASWCPPCRTSFPLLNDLRNKLKDQGFEILGLSEDNRKKASEKFLRRTKVDFPIAWDKGGTIARQYQVRAMPSSFLVDKKGIVRHIYLGYSGKAHMGKLEADVDKLLKEAP